MGSQTVITNNDNFLHVDYDKSKLLIQYGKFEKVTFLNNTGGLADFAQGLVLGRDSSVDQVVPLNVANNTNGEDNVAGILYQPLSQIGIAGTQADVSMLVEGDVDPALVIMQAGTLATVNAAKYTISADLQRVGIRLVAGDELYTVDN